MCQANLNGGNNMEAQYQLKQAKTDFFYYFNNFYYFKNRFKQIQWSFAKNKLLKISTLEITFRKKIKLLFIFLY